MNLTNENTILWESGERIEFKRGQFDAWQGWIHPDNRPPRDVDYFSEILSLASSYLSNSDKYNIFVEVYEKTNSKPDISVIALIKELCGKKFKLEERLKAEILYATLYFTMIAEENRKFTKLGKLIKRLGVHQILIENQSVSYAANFSKGMRWTEIRDECKARGF